MPAGRRGEPPRAGRTRRVLRCRATILCVIVGVGLGLGSGPQAGAAEPPVPPGAVEVEPPPAEIEPAPAGSEPAPAGSEPTAASESVTVTLPAIQIDPRLTIEDLIVAATRAFSEEQYETALAYLSAAYARSPLPPILFNIAQTQRKAGYTRAALSTYRRFLVTAPQSPLVPEASAHIAAMQAKLEAEQATRERALAEQRAHDIAAQAERLSKARTAEREQAQRDLRRALSSREQPIYRRKWFWGLVGGLVASSVVVGLSVGLAPKVPPEPVGDLPTQEPRF